MSVQTSVSAAPPRRRVVTPGAGDRALVTSFATNYRFWARLPASVNAVVFLADPQRVTRSKDKILAVVGRPIFPVGVCTGCGCSEFDACLVGDGRGCSWINDTRSRCSHCGPSPGPRGVRRRKP